MDPQTSEIIEKLKSDKRILANKLMELSNAVKNSFAKLERKIEEKFAMYENKLDAAAKLTEALQSSIENVEAKNVDESFANEQRLNDFVIVFNKKIEGVESLKVEQCKLDALINQIDDKISSVNVEIQESIVKIETLEDEAKQAQRKVCIYDRKGYCKEGNNCLFAHAQEICTDYMKSRICTRNNCRKRHPRPCRYFSRNICRRGDSCRYLHEKKASLEKCDHCDKLVKNTYYCEFCGKSFCSSCTVQEAHYRNMYNQEEHPKQCTSIHKERTGLVHL